MQGRALGDLVWDVHALRLLTGKLSANIVLTRPTGSVRGDFDVGLNKSVTARNVLADLPLDQDVMSLLPGNLRTIHGTAHADIAFAHVVNNIVTQLQGRIELHDLEDHDRDVLPLGNYSLTFPGGSGDPTGQLQDLGGPLAVQGTVRLTQDQPGLELQGYVTPRADAAPALLNQLAVPGVARCAGAAAVWDYDDVLGYAEARDGRRTHGVERRAPCAEAHHLTSARDRRRPG